MSSCNYSNITKKQLEKLIKDANHKYFNTDNKDGMDDKTYDMLIDKLREIEPKHKLLTTIGAPVDKKKKKTLPYILPSANKIKYEEKNKKQIETKLNNWIKKYASPYIISHKLDGVSALIVNNNKISMYTRGESTIGTDITNLIPWLDLPKIKEKYAIRGELIISKKDFKKLENSIDINVARNAVSGIVNAKNPNKDILKYLSFVAYECIHFDEIPMIPSEQFSKLKKEGFTTSPYVMVDHLTIEFLQQHLLKCRQNSKFEIDGIIVSHDKMHKRSDKNPDHMFAFKQDNNYKQTTIVDVIYSVSKDGKLKPRAKMTKTNFNGTVVEYATLNNGKFVVDNNIGKGAIVEITMGGDIIPKVVKTIKPAKVTYPTVPYIWNSSKVEFMVVSSEMNKEQLIKQLINFCQKMDIKHVSKGLIEKFVSYGVNSISDLINMDEEMLLNMDGIQEKTCQKILSSIQTSITDVPIEVVMVASNCFGPSLGSKKLQTIATSLPITKLMKKYDKKNVLENIVKLDGFSTKTAHDFVQGFDAFIKFVKNNKKITIKSENKKTNNTLKNLVVVFSGIRNKELEKQIETNGGKVTTSVSNNTTHVIVNDLSQISSKITKAKSKNIPIMLLHDFINNIL